MNVHYNKNSVEELDELSLTFARFVVKLLFLVIPILFLAIWYGQKYEQSEFAAKLAECRIVEAEYNNTISQIESIYDHIKFASGRTQTPYYDRAAALAKDYRDLAKEKKLQVELRRKSYDTCHPIELVTWDNPYPKHISQYSWLDYWLAT